MISLQLPCLILRSIIVISNVSLSDVKWVLRVENKTIKPICFSPFFGDEFLILMTLSDFQKTNWVTAIERGTKLLWPGACSREFRKQGNHCTAD